MLILAPSLLVVALGLLRIASLRQCYPLPTAYTHTLLFRLQILASCAAIAATAYLAFVKHIWTGIVSIDSAAVASLLAAFGVASALSYYEHTRTRIMPIGLQCFWLAIAVGLGLRVRTGYLQGDDSREFHSYFALSVISLITFALEIVPPATTLSASSAASSSASVSPSDLPVSPEEGANILSVLTFSWISPLIARGYQQPLVADDLYDLPSSVTPELVSEQFQAAWSKECSNASANGSQPSLVWTLARSFGSVTLLAGLFKVGQDACSFVQPQLLKRLIAFVSSYSTQQDGSSLGAQPASDGYFIAWSMLIVAMVQTGLLHQYFQLNVLAGIRIKNALISAVYQKSLKLSSAARQTSTVGEIVNLMSVDSSRIADFLMYGHILWSGPFQIILSLYFLHQTLGWSIYAGVAIMIISVPINGFMARQMRALQGRQMKNKDARIRLTDEVLGAARIIKLYAWEQAFIDKINYIRNEQELRTLRQYALLGAIQSFMVLTIPFLVSFCTFALYSLADGVTHGPLTAELMFVALALFNQLRFPLAVFPNVVASLVETSVSIDRLWRFFTADELDPNAVKREEAPIASYGDSNIKPEMASIVNGSFRWSPADTNIDGEEIPPALENVNLHVRRGELLSIVGKVGSGKSSIISALLGEMVKDSGDVTLRGKVAYVSQQPYVMNATLRDNILFGHRYDPVFYAKTLEACCLLPDIAMLPGGDQVEIGEKGVTLSGGQRARIGLARAVYARADVYLFDDPLSALDAHVGRSVFDNVIGPHGLLRSRARVLVTHALRYLKDTDYVLLLSDGRIIEEGRYQDFMSRVEEDGQAASELQALVREYGSSGAADSEESATATPTAAPGSPVTTRDTAVELAAEVAGGAEAAEEQGDLLNLPNQPVMPVPEAKSVTRRASVQSLPPASLAPIRRPGRSASIVAPAAITEVRPVGALMTAEESAKGEVSWSVYAMYVKACSVSGVLVFLSCLLLLQACNIGSNFWLKDWSEANKSTDDKPEPSHADTLWFLSIYGVYGLCTGLSAFAQSFTMWTLCAIRSARVTHEQMLNAVLRAPMSWFDQTPIGRITNRFSKDQNTIDEVLPRSWQSFFQTLLAVAAAMFTISIATPSFILVIIPLSVVYFGIQKYYLPASRELKRLDSTSRSPVFAHFQQTLGGVSTIRAYGATFRFTCENVQHLDLNTKAYYAAMALNRWLAVRLETIGSLIILSASLLSVIGVIRAKENGTTIESGLVGLAVSYSLNITQSLNWCIRQSAEIETNLVSVERVAEYIDLPSEAPAIIDDVRPPAAWPESGRIEFRDFETRYRPELPLVLRGISCEIQPGERIGIVGRTGAGKSSLTGALFRIIEAASGAIIIDGINIARIGLYDLRSRLMIVPQDTVLFSGTVRENLDPFGVHDDEEIWRALEATHLKNHVLRMGNQLAVSRSVSATSSAASLPRSRAASISSNVDGDETESSPLLSSNGEPVADNYNLGLDAIVAQGGENFSIGQRQLICLARALLRRTSILVLDEATAAIDSQTDALLQRTIRSEFAQCTILTIAHRIDTILDSTRIMVLDAGKIVEMDTPEKLLENPSSIFSGLVREAGVQFNGTA
ncbi:hypothetical protein GQ42DRAFT_162835 [Ramicandelaber brevisporus]|nr:hypothetical protein GQ42DRAFT_162835 [Ramicandelaber brevisporus]